MTMMTMIWIDVYRHRYSCYNTVVHVVVVVLLLLLLLMVIVHVHVHVHRQYSYYNTDYGSAD
jgi:hypothetical protein